VFELDTLVQTVRGTGRSPYPLVLAAGIDQKARQGKAQCHCSFTLSVAASYMHVCKRNDPQLNECIVNSIETLRPYLLKGKW